jgi:hypothetical protein
MVVELKWYFLYGLSCQIIKWGWFREELTRQRPII